jgi:hypothetical protein
MAADAKAAGKVKSFAFAAAAPEVKFGPSAQALSSRKSVLPPSAAPSHERGDSPLTEMDDDESETGGSSDSDGGDATAPKIASPKGVTRLTLAKHKEWVHGHLTNEITVCPSFPFSSQFLSLFR